MKTPRISRLSHAALLLISSAYLTTAHAYKQNDVREIAPPAGKVMMLRGYNSTDGALANVCLKPVKKSRVKSSVDNEAGNSRLEYITSFEEVMKEKKVDVSVDVKVRFGLGKAQASTDLSFYEKRNSEASSGAMWAYYSDNEAPEFSNPSAKYELTEDAKALYKKAIKRGRPSLFADYCGDEAVIGFKNGRYIEGFLSSSSMKSMSESEKQVRVEAAASYMGSSGSAKVNVNGRKFSRKEMSNLRIEMRTSGDSKVANGVNLKSFRNAFRDFPKQAKKDTRDLINVFVIDYKDLIAESEFDFGLKGSQLRKVKTILNGLSTLERAVNTAKIDTRILRQKNASKVISVKYGIGSSSIKIGGAKTSTATLDHFRRELTYVKAILRANKGCLRRVTKAKKWPQECQNLYERFSAFKPIAPNRFKQFMKTAYLSKGVCKTGHSITTPSGKRICRKCSVAKEPIFLNQRNGQCGYIVDVKARGNGKRLWAHDLILKKDKTKGEAGVFSQKLSYPDWCKCKGAGCGQVKARQLCKRKGFNDVERFKIWDWNPKNSIHQSPFFTEYGKGKRCSNDKNSFSKNSCRTFKYIDCLKENGKKQKKRKINNKKNNKR